MPKKSWIGRLIACIESLIFPAGVTCLCCPRALDEDERDGLCVACVRALEGMREAQAARDAQGGQACAPGIDRVLAAYPYEAQVRKLILGMKFSGLREAAGPLCGAMGALDLGDADLLVPVPTSKRRMRERGYNQAALLAHGVSRLRGVQTVEAIERISERGKQSLLTAAQRRKNLVGCMRADARVAGKSVVLVDDIYTTGSTATEAARALREAGARRVMMICAARTRMDGRMEEPEFDRLRKKLSKRDNRRGKV